MKRVKILWYTNIPSPYRVDFFNMLGVTEELKVVFQYKNTEGRNDNWYNYEFDEFDAVYMDKYVNFFAIKKKLAEFINEFKPDIIFNCDYSSAGGMAISRIAKKKKIPLVIEADGGIPKNFNYILKKVISHELQLADYCFSSSEITDKYFLFYGVPNNKLVRFTFTSLSKAEIEINMKSNDEMSFNKKKRILSVGQIIHRKGYDLLLEALSAFNDEVECIIVGGTITAELQSIIDKYELNNVEFLDFKPKEELNELYRNADIFVLPTREDIWGLVINEALSFKLPILSSDNCVAGCHFVNKYNCGMLFENGNITDLQDKLRLMISSDELLGDFSSNTELANESSNMETMVDDHIKFINKIMGNSNSEEVTR